MRIRWIREKLSGWGWSYLPTDSTSSFPWGWCTETRLRPGTAVWANNRSGITKCQVLGDITQRVNVSHCSIAGKSQSIRNTSFFSSCSMISWEIPWKARLLEVFGLRCMWRIGERQDIHHQHVSCKQTDSHHNSPKGIKIQLSCSLWIKICNTEWCFVAVHFGQAALCPSDNRRSI